MNISQYTREYRCSDILDLKLYLEHLLRSDEIPIAMTANNVCVSIYANEHKRLWQGTGEGSIVKVIGVLSRNF